MPRTLAMALAVGLVLTTASVASAGVEPSPFFVRLAKLDLVARSLEGADTVLIELQRTHPPEPGRPDPYTLSPSGLADELRGLAKHVQRSGEMLEETIDGHPPPDDGRELALLNAIGSAADLLLAGVENTPPPDDQSVANALAKLGRNAADIRDTIDAVLR